MLQLDGTVSKAYRVTFDWRRYIGFFFFSCCRGLNALFGGHHSRTRLFNTLSSYPSPGMLPTHDPHAPLVPRRSPWCDGPRFRYLLLGLSGISGSVQLILPSTHKKGPARAYELSSMPMPGRRARMKFGWRSSLTVCIFIALSSSCPSSCASRFFLAEKCSRTCSYILFLRLLPGSLKMCSFSVSE